METGKGAFIIPAQYSCLPYFADFRSSQKTSHQMALWQAVNFKMSRLCFQNFLALFLASTIFQLVLLLLDWFLIFVTFVGWVSDSIY